MAVGTAELTTGLLAVQEIKYKKPQVIVATPGRLIDLLQNHRLDISSSRY